MPGVVASIRHHCQHLPPRRAAVALASARRRSGGSAELQTSQGAILHAIIVDVSISDVEQAQRELRERTVPAVSQAPGFVSGYWIEHGEGKGHSVVVFETEEQATAMAERVRSNAPEAVTVENVSVHEVVAHA